MKTKTKTKNPIYNKIRPWVTNRSSSFFWYGIRSYSKEAASPTEQYFTDSMRIILKRSTKK